MYLPKYFAEQRVTVLHALIRAHPLAALVTRGEGGLDASHIPMEIDAQPAPYGTLRGHIAHANSLWRDGTEGDGALAIFRGPDAYVSPDWYPSKREHGKVVPTWNYAVVHAHGALRFIEDRDWLRGLVERLTLRHEGGRPRPWQVDDAPAAFIEQLLGAIVGIEMRVTRLEGKWKASQNRPPADRNGVRDGLAGEAGRRPAELDELVRKPTPAD